MILLFALLPLLLVAGAPPAAGDVSPLRATELSVCEEIVDLRCPGTARSFDASVESVAVLSKIEGATGEAFVVHVWTFEGKEVKRVRLPVRTASYRIWSSKRVKGLPGKWRVEVFDPLSRSLGAVDFAVDPPRAP